MEVISVSTSGMEFFISNEADRDKEGKIFIVISESRQLQISLLSSPSLMNRDFKTTSTLKRPDFST
jgi:hypothetical protein